MGDRGRQLGWWRQEDGDAFESLAFLLRSKHRVAVLEALDRRTWERRDLQDGLEVSRPTLARILGEFETRGWVARDDDGTYGTTTAGSLLAAELLGSLQSVGTITRLEAVLELVPAGVMPSDPSILADATVTVAEPGAPSRPGRRLDALVDESATYRECTPIELGRSCRTRLASHLGGDGTASIVYETHALKSLLADPDSAVLAALEDDRLRVRVTDSVPVRLVVLEDRVAVARYDETTGAMTALLEAVEPEARRWAAQVFETAWADAEPFANDAGTNSESREGPVALAERE